MLWEKTFPSVEETMFTFPRATANPSVEETVMVEILALVSIVIL